MVGRCIDQVYGDQSRIDEAVKGRYFELAMRPGNQEASIEVFTVMRKLCRDPSLSEGISRITVPTLIMWGKLDEWIPYEHVELWKRDLPAARVIAYEGVGHGPMEEIPERSANDVDEFLRQNRSQ